MKSQKSKLCKEPNIKKAQLFVVSLVSFWILMNYGWVVLVIGFSRMVFVNKADKQYIKSIGIAVDDIGGTILYGTIRHTISANIGLREFRGDKVHSRMAKAVDYFFGEAHCYCLAVREKLILEEE